MPSDSKQSKKLAQSRFHFIGVGGIGMCGLAELLANMGAVVTGSDLSANANTEHLQKIGVKVYFGHEASQVGEADVVVFSSAVRFNNPEILEAKKRHIPLIPRAEALAEIMRLKRGIAVAGTHGKTTTTSLVSSIFLQAQLDPTIFVGGRVESIKSTAHLGQGEWLIAEADESDGSFHKLSPELSIITNIDSDHLDHFKTFENLQRSFLDFAHRVPFYGQVFVCGDDDQVFSLFENFAKRILFYGFNSRNDVVLKPVSGGYEMIERGKSLGVFTPSMPGRHNALNSAAAIMAGLAAGVDFKVCAEGIAHFTGVDRRFQFKGEQSGVKVYDDYGHHPTEVRATLQAFKEKFPTSRLVVYFQPHRYSRTEFCWNEFLGCFGEADHLLLTDIYAAGEAPLQGITSERLFAEIKNPKKVFLPKDQVSAARVVKELKAGDVFVTLGAGDGWKLGLAVLEELK